MMDVIPVVVKHGGKKYNIDLDPSSDGITFKYQVMSVTEVEPERQKIIVKGGQLKDDADLSKLGIKPGHQFLVMGTPSSTSVAIEKPKEKMRFVEDMTEAEAAQSEGATPAGLENLGNTCYMNSTLQALRAIPELQTELQLYKPGQNTGPDLSQFTNLAQLTGSSSLDLTASLRDLFKQMSETQRGFAPIHFLTTFRNAFPQFAEMARDGRHYAQQDAEEAWSQLVTTMQQKLKMEKTNAAGETTTTNTTFIDEYLGGKYECVEEPDDEAAKEAGETPQKKPDETFYKLNCHVASREINHLREGVAAALSDTYTKTSPTLNREASYTLQKRISRLPKYLPVHFVRFFWKRDVNKKAKILRKVTFPFELDVAEHCSDALRELIVPVRDKIRDLRKEELDVERARKRQRRGQKAQEAEAERTLKATGPADEATLAAEKPQRPAGAPPATTNGDAEMADADGESYKTDAQLEAERAAQILAAKRELLAAVSPELLADAAANHTGLYELRGVVTHAGASADSGHYTAYVKKDARGGGAGEKDDAGDKWWWFNDEKVSEVEQDKIELLAGGGESHSALILLYRAVELPTLTEEELKSGSGEGSAS